MLSQDKQPTCYMPQGNGSPSPAFGRVVGQKPFFKQGSYTTVAATWGTVAEFTVPTGFEGELVHASGADVAGASNLDWRLRINGALPGDIPEWTGVWSALDKPRLLRLPLRGGERIALEVKSGANGLIVRGSLSGWTAPETSTRSRNAMGLARS